MDLAPLALTVAVYALATRVPRVPAVVTASTAIVVLLPVLHLSLAEYLRGTGVLVALLAPAIVALALPLARERDALRTAALPVGAAIVAGALSSIAATVLLGRLFGLDHAVVAALAPRAATAAVAAAVAGAGGADVHLAAAASVAGAALLALVAPLVLRAGARDGGLALGVAAHGIGVARAAALDRRAAAFAAAAMALCAIVTALAAPLVVR